MIVKSLSLKEHSRNFEPSPAKRADKEKDVRRYMFKTEALERISIEDGFSGVQSIRSIGANSSAG